MKGILDGGVNVVRINFSHNDEKDHLKRIKAIRQYEKDNDTFIGILMDLQGPKIRISSFKNNKVKLSLGDQFTLDADLPEMEGDQEAVGIAYKELPNDLNAGNILLLDDGKIILKVDRIKNSKIFTTVIQAGTLYNNKGINLRGGGLSASALTDKDKSDILIAAKADADYVAISFPINADDVRETKSLLLKAGSNASVIAKIERAEALEEDIITEIIQESAGIMVARGDLGVEIGDPQLPAQQKRLIQLARANDRFVITATQMLESMIDAPAPTRAEASDVAGAVFDGADAVMLSAETAAGQYPVEAVEFMARIVSSAEAHVRSDPTSGPGELPVEKSVYHAVARTSVGLAETVEAKVMGAFSSSGNTAVRIARERPAIPFLVMTPHLEVQRKLCLLWGTYTAASAYSDDFESAITEAIFEIRKRGMAGTGQQVVIVAGMPFGIVGTTNSMRVVTL